jgi:hypothetical protein
MRTCKGCGCALPEDFQECSGDNRHSPKKERPRTTCEILDACLASPSGMSGMKASSGVGNETHILFNYEKLYRVVDELVVQRDASIDVLNRLKLVLEREALTAGLHGDAL